jgi:crossover junction endodeoxyribonuclease RuvC
MTTLGMRILGIDPGLSRTGYGCVSVGPDGCTTMLVEAGVLRLPRGTPLPHRLRQLELDLAEVFDELAPDVLAVESVFTHSRNLRTAILMAHARGVILLAGARRGCPLIEVAPATVKKSLTGAGRASKAQMQLAIAARFGLDAPPEPADVADALAIALAGARRAERITMADDPAAVPRARSAGVPR